MTSTILRGTTVLGTSGVTWAALASATDGPPGLSTTSYATWTSAVSGAVAYIAISGFNFPAFPAGDELQSVTVTLRHFPNNATRITSVVFQPYDGSNPIGSPATGTLTTSVHGDSATFPVTAAQLVSPNFNVRATITRGANTTSTIWNIDAIDVTAVYGPPLPPIETLVDSFETTVDKTVVWAGSSAQVVWDAGRARIPSTTAYYTLATPNTGGYKLTGSSVMAQLTLPAISATRETFMELFRAGVTNDKLSMYVSGTTLSARRTVVGTNTGVTGSGITYNPTTHAWWRIRESGGLVYFEYSADGIAWSTLGSIAPGWDISNVWLGINSGYYSTGTALDAYVDNVNTLGAPVVADGRPKVWTGSAWVKKPVKVWTGSAWVTKPMKVWTGSQWKLL